MAEVSPPVIACRGTGKLLLNGAALDRLQALRDRLGKPLIVRSAYRSPEHNRAVGGAKRPWRWINMISWPARAPDQWPFRSSGFRRRSTL